MKITNTKTGETYIAEEYNPIIDFLFKVLFFVVPRLAILLFLAFPFLLMGNITHSGGLGVFGDFEGSRTFEIIIFKFIYGILYIPNLIVPLPFLNEWSLGGSQVINYIFRGIMSLAFIAAFYGLLHGLITIINNRFLKSIKTLYVVLIVIHVPLIILLICVFLF